MKIWGIFFDYRVYDKEYYCLLNPKKPNFANQKIYYNAHQTYHS